MFSHTTHKQLSQLFILLTIVLQATASAERNCAFSSEITVHVVSNLPQNTPQLFLRCQSHDDDLGNHTLAPNQDFHWHFCTSFNTLFFCHLVWNGKSASFDVFNYDWPDSRCPYGTCYWAALPDGIYQGFQYPPTPSTLIKQYSW
ncbi:hypothetical protein ABFS83_07G096400 [Erythranthe nasuta]